MTLSFSTFLASLRTARVAVQKGAMSAQRPKVLVITGPTAVGKSATALKLCQVLDGEIISADSVQVYKHLNVGSNKATQYERSLVPHHLIDVLDPSRDEFTAGDFFRAARSAIEDVTLRNKLPIVVGGTMMYVRWLIYGRPATPPADDETKLKVKETISSLNGDWEAAISLLAEKDAKRAQQLSPNDWYRLGRALEICETSGKGVTDLPLQGGAPRAEQESKLDYDFRCVFLHDVRVELSRRIDERCERMILPKSYSNRNDNLETKLRTETATAEESILEEVSSLLLSYNLRVASAAPSRAIGYKQTISYLVERALWLQQNTEEQPGQAYQKAIEAFRAYLHDFQSATRGYAKQQFAWFRKEAQFQWVKAGNDTVSEISQMLQLMEPEYTDYRSDIAHLQEEVRKDMIFQGKQMKTYIPQQQYLIENSDLEKQAIDIAEKCALDMASKLPEKELNRLHNFVNT